MKKLLLFLFLLASLSSFGQSDQYYNSVYSLFAEQEDGGMSMLCTATAFSSDAIGPDYIVRFVTASHCIEKINTHYYIMNGDTYTKTFLPAMLVGAGKEEAGNDFAVLEVITEKDIPTIALGDDPVTLDGQDIIAISDVLGLGKQLLQGSISRLTLDRVMGPKAANWEGYFLLQLPGATTGSSGSAVICLKQHKICGFIVGEVNERVVTASRISDFKVWYNKLQAHKGKK